MSRCGFAFGAQVGVIVQGYGDIRRRRGRDKAFHADVFFPRELAVRQALAPIDADVAEGSAEIACVTGVEDDALDSVDDVAFPPQGRPVRDVAVVARECSVQCIEGYSLV